MHNYHETFGCLPPAWVPDNNGRPMHSWRALLLPFIDEQQLHQQYRFDEPWDGPNNRRLLNRRPRTYALHDRNDQPGSGTNYVVIVGPNTAWPGAVGRRFDEFSNGLGETILVAENVGADIAWSEPRDLALNSMSLDLSAHAPDGISSGYEPSGVVMADGTLRQLPTDEVSPDRLRQMLLIDGSTTTSGSPSLQLDDGRNRSNRNE